MTTRGGESYRHRSSMICASLMMTALTLLAPAFTSAEPMAEDPVTTPVFTTSAAYRTRVDTIRLKTNSLVTSVTFTAGDRTIAALPAEVEDGAAYKVWRPDIAPSESVAGATLSARATAADTSEPASNSVALYDVPTLSLAPYDGARGGSTLAVNGTVEDGLNTSSVHVRLLGTSLDTVVAARGTGLELTQLSLPSGLDGSYTLELSAEDAYGQLTRAETPVQLNTIKPSVAGLALDRTVIYPSTAFTLTGTSSKGAGGSAQLDYDGQRVPIGLDAQGGFSYTFSQGLALGEHTFSVILTDALGNTNLDSLSPSDILDMSIVAAPVKPSSGQLLTVVDLQPVQTLSTDFSIPVASNLLTATKRPAVFGGTVAATTEPSEVAGAEYSTLEKVVDLGPTQQPATPLAPTSGGWSLFGVAWHWWAASAVTAWLAGWGVRWWLRKP